MAVKPHPEVTGVLANVVHCRGPEMHPAKAMFVCRSVLAPKIRFHIQVRVLPCLSVFIGTQ